LTCKEERDNPVYIKAYTISRCVNSCGKFFFDCSCNSSCVKNGTCCSDYRFCQVIQENHITNTKIPNCKIADEDDTICLQCKENFYYYNNKCLLKCPEIEKDSTEKGKLNNYSNDSKTNIPNYSNSINLFIINRKNDILNAIIPYEENKICKEMNLGIFLNL